MADPLRINAVSLTLSDLRAEVLVLETLIVESKLIIARADACLQHGKMLQDRSASVTAAPGSSDLLTTLHT